MDRIWYQILRLPMSGLESLIFITISMYISMRQDFLPAVALAHGILKEGASAVERYKKFLSGGCSASPVELLKIAGVNLETPKPIQEALDVFGEVLDEIEALLAE